MYIFTYELIILVKVLFLKILIINETMTSLYDNVSMPVSIETSSYKLFIVSFIIKN